MGFQSSIHSLVQRERERERDFCREYKWEEDLAVPKRDSTEDHGLLGKIRSSATMLKSMEKGNGETFLKELVRAISPSDFFFRQLIKKKSSSVSNFPPSTFPSPFPFPGDGLINLQVWKDVGRVADWDGWIIWGQTLREATSLRKKKNSLSDCISSLATGNFYYFHY